MARGKVITAVLRPGDEPVENLQKIGVNHDGRDVPFG
ncbi:hypothetical protein C7967_105304 [Thalassospira sp. 11-3]|jgi:hypothetical protein|nr:hypothetical protein KO164_3546 [Thalassospira sp. KO164]PXX32133.1 hypothetical protein C7967_105304 [Thalassospira sp. 11-3]SEE71959.1 hypothetical protein SAMN04515623_3585 [Thalassospira permensis]